MAQYDFIATYLLANRKNGTLYVGSTSDLITRMGQHRSGAGSHFTGKYGVARLVWFERFPEMEPALRAERRMKEWKRQWKIDLIEKGNPDWDDLTMSLTPY
ncbi:MULTISPECIES: GIY-YIG nuclease family protein [Henriciella]|uniref:GIY-YIG endonuclease n=1 Tax=Henriciella pelagia TaxID=1977912 RepID=A0ABQ1JUE2_9PROT|nr:GIY-YIG nuclease family protein [Henriciella pelagia]GGB77342.1 GIY-YIG endonuclease [Henriciella pelagia]